MKTEIDLNTLEEAEPDCPCPLDVWVRLPPNENGYNYIKRKRYRTFHEIFVDLHKAMDQMECENCGTVRKPPKTKRYADTVCKCGKNDWVEWIGEYDSCPLDPNREIAQRDEEIVSIMCYHEPGGNEGYHANVSVTFRSAFDGGRETHRTVHLYWIKHFGGMQFSHNLVKHLMKATGVWTPHC